MEMEYFQLYIYIYITRDNEANGQENLYHQIPYVGRGWKMATKNSTFPRLHYAYIRARNDYIRLK